LPGPSARKKSFKKEVKPANFEANIHLERMAGIFLFKSYIYRATEKYHAKAV
jgi:hypothetical protein